MQDVWKEDFQKNCNYRGGNLKSVLLFFYLILYRIKAAFQYPLDLFVGVLGTILWHLPGLIMLFVLSSSNLAQLYSVESLILLYGLSVFGDGIQHTFFEALWQFGNRYIINGDFDGVITKPVSSYVQVVTSRFDIDGLGGVLLGLFCCTYYLHSLEMIETGTIVCLFLSLITSGLIFVGINTITSAMAFLIYNNFPLSNSIFQLHTFARYPKKAYPHFITIILTFIIPMFWATYYPSQIIELNHIQFAIFVLSGAVLFLICSILFWNYLSKSYKSTGT